MTTIKDFHAHVYFDEETVEQGQALCETARDEFDIEMGRMHLKPIGPHPRWSCQLRVQNDQIGDVIAWLCLKRNGLTIFIHPETGNHLADHTRHTMWMGEMLELDLSIFE